MGCYAGPRDRSLAKESIAELRALASAAGAVVVGQALQERPARDPAYFVGRGKAEELREIAAQENLDLLVFDEELTPGQQRNLENKVGCKIVDRTQLILDIFARRARTREGKLQVELAQLNYLLPRLTGKGTMLSRLGAGIGTRGPGETKLEMDRRRIRNRIALLRREIEKVRMLRRLQRAKRQNIPLPVVALVGYTNAGKSTLFNALTSAGTVASPQLFATLDPLLRRLSLPDGLEVILSDTVGFVRKLPHDLVAAFRATLEEVREATLLLHVVDISIPGWREQVDAVEDVLVEIGAQATPRIEVFNKTDLLTNGVNPLREANSDIDQALFISARNGTGLDGVIRRMRELLDSFFVHADLKIPYAQAGILSRLHEEARITSETYESDGIRIGAEMPRQLARSLRTFQVR